MDAVSSDFVLARRSLQCARAGLTADNFAILATATGNPVELQVPLSTSQRNVPGSPKLSNRDTLRISIPAVEYDLELIAAANTERTLAHGG